MEKNGLDTTQKILKMLALQREKAQYDLPEELEIHYSTVFRQLKKLEKKNLVKVVKTEKARKRGKDKKFFGLTLLGWLTCYGQNILTTEYIPNLVEAFKDEVPLILGKWDYFKNEGVEKIAEKHLVNTLKICEFKYQAEVMKGERVNKSNSICDKDPSDKLISERMLAAEVTDVFLFFALTSKYSSEYRGLFAPLSHFDEIRLKEVLNRNKQLNFYRTQMGRRLEWSHLDFEFEFSSSILGKNKEFCDYPWQKFFDSEKCNRKLIDMLFMKLDKERDFKTPFEKIVNAVFDGNYFSATFEMCKLYEAYPFVSVDEIHNKLFTIIEFLAIERIKQKTRNLHLTPEKYREEYTKCLRKATLEILAALQLFKIKFTQVWVTIFGQLTLNVSLKRFEQNKEQSKAEALASTESWVKDNNIDLGKVSHTVFVKLLKPEDVSSFGENLWWKSTYYEESP